MKIIPLALAAYVLSLTACREEAVTHTRVPKTQQTDASMASMGGLDEHAGHQHGLRWTLPSGWKEAPGNGMRLATLIPPGSLKAEGTVVALPGESGGELANVNRWRGQIGLPATDEASMAAARTTLATKAGPAAIHDFTSAGTNRTRLIAAIVRTGETSWFFKLMGPAADVQTAREGFLTLIKSLSSDASH